MRKNLASQTDNELAILCKDGDESAFAEIYKRYYQRIVNWVNKITHDVGISEDVTQESFLKALVALKKGQYRGEGFSTWLHVIAKNNALNYVEHEKFCCAIVDSSNLKSTNDPAQIFDGKEKIAIFLKIVDTMTERQKIVLNLKLHGLTTAEIRSTTGLNKHQIWFSMKTARERFNLAMVG